MNSSIRVKEHTVVRNSCTLTMYNLFVNNPGAEFTVHELKEQAGCSSDMFARTIINILQKGKRKNIPVLPIQRVGKWGESKYMLPPLDKNALQS